MTTTTLPDSPQRTPEPPASRRVSGGLLDPA